MYHMAHISRNTRPCKNKQAQSSTMVSFKSDSIPKLWSYLPFVNQTRIIATQQQLRIYKGKPNILVGHPRSSHI